MGLGPGPGLGPGLGPVGAAAEDIEATEGRGSGDASGVSGDTSEMLGLGRCYVSTTQDRYV